MRRMWNREVISAVDTVEIKVEKSKIAALTGQSRNSQNSYVCARSRGIFVKVTNRPKMGS